MANKKSSLFKIKKVIFPREIIILFAAIILSIVFYFTSTDHAFFSGPCLRTMVILGSEYGIIAVGVTILMIAGEFDLSVGSILGFSAYSMAILYNFGLNPLLVMLIVLLGGGAMGFLNGLIVVKTGIPSFIATLGTMWLWRGVLYVISAGRPKVVYIKETIFCNIFTGKIGVIPVQFIWFILFTVILSLLLETHKFGNHVFATGGNKMTARAMGINIHRTKIICFILTGALCAFAGVMQSTRLRSAYSNQGLGYELEIIAATVVGGTSLFGGAGTIVGSFLGVLVIRMINTGLITSRVPGYYFKAAIGATLILVVVFNTVFRGKMSRY